MRGDLVIVRAFGNRPLRRRVWDVSDTVVFITDDEQFERLAVGEQAVSPIGFPKEDVFSCTASESYDDAIDWTSLAPWQDE